MRKRCMKRVIKKIISLHEERDSPLGEEVSHVSIVFDA
jgi:hypothetical protein